MMISSEDIAERFWSLHRKGVPSRFGSLPYLFNPLQKKQYLVNENSSDPLVRSYLSPDLNDCKPDLDLAFEALESGLLDSPERMSREFEHGHAPWPNTYLFLPEELTSILETLAISDLKLSGPGAFSRSVPNEILKRMLLDEDYKERFLEFCYAFDSHPSVSGLGKDNRSPPGLFRASRLTQNMKFEPLSSVAGISLHIESATFELMFDPSI